MTHCSFFLCWLTSTQLFPPPRLCLCRTFHTWRTPHAFVDSLSLHATVDFFISRSARKTNASCASPSSHTSHSSPFLPCRAMAQSIDRNTNHQATNGAAPDEALVNAPPLAPRDSRGGARTVSIMPSTAPPPTQDSNGDATPPSSAKRGVVRRATGPSVMQVQRAEKAQSSEWTGYSTAYAAQQPQEPASTQLPLRSAWAACERAASTASPVPSVPRDRTAAALQEYLNAPAVNAKGSSASPPRRGTPSRSRYSPQRDDVGRVGSASPPRDAPQDRLYRAPSGRREFAPASARDGAAHTARSRSGSVSGAAASSVPFRLLSAGRPVPEMSAELEEAVTTYYLARLRELSAINQERVVYAIALEHDRRAVLMALKQPQLQQPSNASVAAPPPPAVPSSLLSVGRTARSGPSHPAPKNAPQPGHHERSHRRVMQTYHVAEQNAHQEADAVAAAAMARFRARFVVEACAAFLDDAMEVCLARRIRFYQEQPPIAKQLRVVLPEEQIVPHYVKTVASMLYNIAGWTQAEAGRYAREVVAIIHPAMPVVVASAAAPPAAAGALGRRMTESSPPLSQRPPVPMAPGIVATPQQQQQLQQQA